MNTVKNVVLNFLLPGFGFAYPADLPLFALFIFATTIAAWYLVWPLAIPFHLMIAISGCYCRRPDY